MRPYRGCGGAFAAGCVIALGAPVLCAQSAFESYGSHFRVVNAPAPESGSFTTVGDALADGRLIAATGHSIYVETGVGTGAFDLAATIDTSLFASAPDPSFLKVSPDGTRIALGGGFDFGTSTQRPIIVFDAALLSPGGATTLSSANASVIALSHYQAAWADNDRLAITAGGFGSPASVQILDIATLSRSPIMTVAVSNIQGASAGIAFDSAGRLYTGNGFANGSGPSDTGWIKVFETHEWQAPGGVDFESGGVFVVDALSADALSMDGFGNLFIGGGDFFGSGDSGYMGIASQDAIADALSGGGPIDTSILAGFRRLDPAGFASSFYGTFFNAATGELVVTDGATWYVTVPSPGALFSLAVGASTLVWRRRRAA